MRKLLFTFLTGVFSITSSYAQSENQTVTGTTSSTENMVVCTMEYAPVCGENITTKEQKTFGNSCTLSTDKAYKFIHTGVCANSKSALTTSGVVATGATNTGMTISGTTLTTSGTVLTTPKDIFNFADKFALTTR